jgi:hypothetical protein
MPTRWITQRVLRSALGQVSQVVPGPAGAVLRLLRPASLLTPTLIAFSAGVAVGTGVTLLTTPRTGEQNRAALKALARPAPAVQLTAAQP